VKHIWQKQRNYFILIAINNSLNNLQNYFLTSIKLIFLTNRIVVHIITEKLC